MSSFNNVILVEVDARAIVETGVEKVVKVAVMMNRVFKSRVNGLINRLLNCPGEWSQSDSLAQKTLLRLDDSDLCLL